MLECRFLYRGRHYAHCHPKFPCFLSLPRSGLSAPLLAQRQFSIQRINKEAGLAPRDLQANSNEFFPSSPTQEKETSALIGPADLKKYRFTKVHRSLRPIRRAQALPSYGRRPGVLKKRAAGPGVSTLETDMDAVADHRKHGTALRESCKGRRPGGERGGSWAWMHAWRGTICT